MRSMRARAFESTLGQLYWRTVRAGDDEDPERPLGSRAPA